MSQGHRGLQPKSYEFVSVRGISVKDFLRSLRPFAAIDDAKRGGGCEFSFVWLEAGFRLA
jgi:hypothetical protein